MYNVRIPWDVCVDVLFVLLVYRRDCIRTWWHESVDIHVAYHLPPHSTDSIVYTSDLIDNSGELCSVCSEAYFHPPVKLTPTSTSCLKESYHIVRERIRPNRRQTTTFLPCDAMRCTVSVIVILSVCLSVRPSVTLVDCVHMVRPTIMISSPYGSPIILVSEDIKFIPKFEGSHPERWRWMRVGWVRIGDFRPISRRISETVRDTTKVTINH